MNLCTYFPSWGHQNPIYIETSLPDQIKVKVETSILLQPESGFLAPRRDPPCHGFKGSPAACSTARLQIPRGPKMRFLRVARFFVWFHFTHTALWFNVFCRPKCRFFFTGFNIIVISAQMYVVNYFSQKSFEMDAQTLGKRGWKSWLYLFQGEKSSR